jgi:hypothetical protein
MPLNKASPVVGLSQCCCRQRCHSFSSLPWRRRSVAPELAIATLFAITAAAPIIPVLLRNEPSLSLH